MIKPELDSAKQEQIVPEIKIERQEEAPIVSGW
jgi:hypothetical protein